MVSPSRYHDITCSFSYASLYTIVTAIGQKVDRTFLRGLEVNPDGTVRIDQKTGETSMKGVFAGGDVVTGPGWAINAIAAGKKGAESIHQYLS
jgi:NADPH-dependent glutamate synthase beta subunit-like oxidoreductase